MLEFFASCPKGLENLLCNELIQLGADQPKAARAGVRFQCEQKTIYKICLWSRLANQILMPLQKVKVANWDNLYQVMHSFDWQEHMLVTQTFAIDVDIINNKTFTNSLYATQKLKDGLVDYWRERKGQRPLVKTIQPDLRLHVLIQRNELTLSLNLSGESLHRRGYRQDTGAAPLKENLAAAILIQSQWPEIAAQGGALFDPLCGSGTLLIEGALLAADIAPGLLRSYFGFLAWQQFHPRVWQDLIEEAKTRRERGLAKLPSIAGCDADANVIRKALINIKQAGLASYIQVEACALSQASKPDAAAGLIITNPPYGMRLGEADSLNFTYQYLGNLLKQQFSGWHFSLFTGNPELAKKLGLSYQQRDHFFNGTIPCQLLQYPIFDTNTTTKITAPKTIAPIETTSEGLDFANRLQKNVAKLAKWANKNQVSCYRLYDADLPDYALAIDRYENKIHVQEYAPPKSIDPKKAEHRLHIALHHISNICGITEKDIFLKTRQKQKGLQQYQKVANEKNFFSVSEGPAKFLVNLSDYLDTGLFLDSRLIRQYIFDHVKQKSFLNLFCYTGSASVYAALAGAKKVMSVDLSATYLQWAKRNIAINGLSVDRYQFLQEDCLAWIETCEERFDLILLDPPTFSNSKRMTDTLDIERDHPELIALCMQKLKPQGTLIFVTNKRNFKLEASLKKEFAVKNITSQTTSEDFKRNPLHQAFLIQALH